MVWRFLLRRSDLEINLQNSHGQTALHTAARFNIPEAAVDILQRSGVDLNLRSRLGSSPAMVAAKYASKETLNLDPDAKASIDIAVANNVNPNPRPWFFPQHSAFFPDKAVLYIGLFENHSDIFRAAPHKWKSLTDAHIRLLQMFVSILELYVITPVSPSMLGDITSKLQDLNYSNNWCRNLLAARQRILERMKLECSTRNDSPWSKSQKQPPAAGEALGEKDWTVQRLGTSIVWTAYEQEIFSSTTRCMNL